MTALSASHGDIVTISLESDRHGSPHTFNLECYTADGWREVRTIPEGDEFLTTTEGYDGGHRWSLELTETGIIDASPQHDDIRVCPVLVSGRYRFVYWGLQKEAALAVAFDLAV